MRESVTLDGPVGLRFRKQNVRNNASDQDKVIKLLAKIPKAQGGKKEEWATVPLTGADGACPSFVSDAIWDFQVFWKNKGHFHNIDGVVDPKMNTLAQMNLLAAGVTPPAPPPGPHTPFEVPLKQNPLVILDGTRAVERTTPIHPAEWVRRTQATFDTICAHPLGRQLVMGRSRKVFVEPYRETDLDAKSSSFPDYQTVSFTADNFDSSASKPGCRADEILFHEFVHLAENNYSLYDDAPGIPLKYARADFLTVTATNVYSSSLGRGIRRDHDGYSPMPSPYGTDPGQHVADFRDSYQKVYSRSRAVFHLFKSQAAPWNPFKLFTP